MNTQTNTDIDAIFDIIAINNNLDIKGQKGLKDGKEGYVEQDNNQTSNIPMFLIDNSGSTSQVFNKTHKSILKTEVDIVKKIMGENKYTECHIMFWNTSETHSKTPVKYDEIDGILGKLGVSSSGGTDISVAIHNIPETWYQLVSNIYILTDGENYDDKYKFSNQVFNLTKRKVNLNIITVEPRDNNYLESQVGAGSIIYKTIQDNKLSKYIRKFECYNNYHWPNSFNNFYNPELKKGQFSYHTHIFNSEDFVKFTEIIGELIEHFINDKNELDKIVYNLSMTIFQYTRDKTQKIKNEIVKIFVRLFEDVYGDLDFIKGIFEAEIKAHEEGVSQTFQQYRENRKRLFEKTQDELFSNVSECFSKGNKFVSFPIQTTDQNKMRLISSDSMSTTIKLSDLNFNSGGIRYGTFNLPMFSIQTLNSESSNQALRQWVRAIYSRTHSIQISDEKILYLFLTDMMSIQLSNLPSYIKEGYHNCARIMLDSNRFNSGGIKQITWLTMGNKPKPMIPGYNTIEEILTFCRNYYNSNLTISPDEFWFGICWTFGIEELKSKQIPETFDINQLITLLTQSNKTYSIQEIQCDNELDYWDWITLEDTSNVGGYKLPDYKIGKKTIKSKFVISQESFNFLKTESNGTTTKCPITGKLIHFDSFIKVEPKKNLVTYPINTDNFGIRTQIFNSLKYEKVDLAKYDKMELKDLELKKATDYDFTNYPYEFTPKVPIITEKLYKERIQYRTTYEFKTQIGLRYKWLEEFDFSNILIAGGFCKSLIFDEKVNDIDIYMYGLEKEQDYSYRLGKLIGDLTQIISTKYHNVVSLQAYKKEFNVYEIIYFENIKDLDKAKFELQDLTQMKYITKIQIIMRKHNLKKDVFSSFDLDSSCVMWDGKDLLFNDRSYIAYKYMINIPRIDVFYTDIFDLRLIKYYNSGFRIVLPRLTVDKIKNKLGEDNSFVINKSKFFVSELDNTNVYIQKTEYVIVKEDRPKNVPISIYNSIIGDLGSLDNSRSIIKFMRYVQRQNRIVERVKNNLESNVQMNKEQLVETINDEMKDELKELKFFGKTNIKSNAYISINDDEDGDEDGDEVNNKIINSKSKYKPLVNPWILTNNVYTVPLIPPSRPSSPSSPTLTSNVVLPPVPPDSPKENLLSNTVQSNNVQSNTIQTNTVQPNDNLDNNLNNNLDNNLDNLIPDEVEELKQPEEYIKVYYKVCTKNSTYKINEFENGTCDLKFIWEYDNYHKEFDWYNKDQEKEQKGKEEEKRKLEENEKRKLKEEEEEKQIQ